MSLLASGGQQFATTMLTVKTSYYYLAASTLEGSLATPSTTGLKTPFSGMLKT